MESPTLQCAGKHTLPSQSPYASEETSVSHCQIPQRQIPNGSWDSHMHVIDPENYPLTANAQYTPHSHLLEQALTIEEKLGLDNIVLVQPSIYGNDNSCLLDALRRVGPFHGRGVVAFDPWNIDVETLKMWHQLGVRGVRVNFQSYGKRVDDGELEMMLRRYADCIRPFNWTLQLYMPLSAMMALERIMPHLRVKVCVDHFGCPPMTNLSAIQELNLNLIPGFISLIRLMEQGNTYVKISAPYRICNDMRHLDTISKTLLKVKGGRRVVFGTDWPHTRHAGLDITPFVHWILGCCGANHALVNQVFRDNAKELWDVN